MVRDDISGLRGLLQYLAELEEEQEESDEDDGVLPAYRLDAEPGAYKITGGDVTLRATGTVADSSDELLIGMSILKLGQSVRDGAIVEAVTIPWAGLVRALKRDPDFLYSFDPRKFEEIVAAAYEECGAFDEVILTPRSADGGRDVIATQRGHFSIRVLDQVKRYKPGSVVTADEVRAVYGVLMADHSASKAYVTTTASFAPGVREEFADRIPTRVDFRDGAAIRAWLLELGGRRA